MITSETARRCGCDPPAHQRMVGGSSALAADAAAPIHRRRYPNPSSSNGTVPVTPMGWDYSHCCALSDLCGIENTSAAHHAGWIRPVTTLLGSGPLRPFTPANFSYASAGFERLNTARRNRVSPKAPGVLARREGPTPLPAGPRSTPSAASNLRARSTYLRQRSDHQ